MKLVGLLGARSAPIEYYDVRPRTVSGGRSVRVVLSLISAGPSHPSSCRRYAVCALQPEDGNYRRYPYCFFSGASSQRRAKASNSAALARYTATIFMTRDQRSPIFVCHLAIGQAAFFFYAVPFLLRVPNSRAAGAA
jgi:hypothetical protein